MHQWSICPQIRFKRKALPVLSNRGLLKLHLPMRALAQFPRPPSRVHGNEDLRLPQGQARRGGLLPACWRCCRLALRRPSCQTALRTQWRPSSPATASSRPTPGRAPALPRPRPRPR